MKYVTKFEAYALKANQTFHVYDAVVMGIEDFTTMSNKEMMKITLEDGSSYVGNYNSEIYEFIESLLDMEISIVLWKRSNRHNDFMICYMPDKWYKYNKVKV